MKNPKQEIITFKVDSLLREKLRKIPNRSEFIRQALLSALERVCPLCLGTGTLNPKQKEHLESFLAQSLILPVGDEQVFVKLSRSHLQGHGLPYPYSEKKWRRQL